MATMKFKVGDIVRGIKGAPYPITSEDMTRGEVVEADERYIRVKMLEHRTKSQLIGRSYLVLPKFFEKVNDWKVVIVPNGDTTIGKLYNGDKVVKEVTTTKSPVDKYSKEEAIKVITERLTKEEPKLYNGKVVCVDNTGMRHFYTVGRIYQFKDGIVTADTGDRFTCYGKAFTSFTEWKNWSTGKFIEVVE